MAIYTTHGSVWSAAQGYRKVFDGTRILSLLPHTIKRHISCAVASARRFRASWPPAAKCQTNFTPNLPPLTNFFALGADVGSDAGAGAGLFYILR